MEKKIAKDLLSIKAVFFRPEEPFTWASGIKSPVYCDNRLTLTAPAVRLDVEEGLAALIKKHYPETEVLMGTSTAGIAHAAITAHLLGLPMGYVRSGAKDHGRQNQIEGKLEPGQKVGQRLRGVGMTAVTGVDDRNGSILRGNVGRPLLGVAHSHDVGIAGKNLSSICHALALRGGGATSIRKADHAAAQLQHCCLKAEAGTGRRLKKQGCQLFAVASLGILGRIFDDVMRCGDQPIQLLHRKIMNVDQTSHLIYRSSFRQTGCCGKRSAGLRPRDGYSLHQRRSARSRQSWSAIRS